MKILDQLQMQFNTRAEQSRLLAARRWRPAFVFLMLGVVFTSARGADIELPKGLESSAEEAAAFLRAERDKVEWKLSTKAIDQWIKRAESGEAANATVAGLLEVMGDSLSRNGDHIRAERALNAALAIRRAVMPSGDNSIGKALGLLGRHLFVAGDTNRAEAVLAEANSFYEAHGYVSEAALDVRVTTTAVYLRLGRTRDAQEQIEVIAEVLAEVAKRGKPMDKSYSARLDTLRGELAYATGRLVTAESHYLAAIDTYERIVGIQPFAGPIKLQGSDELILTLAKIARCLTDQQRYDEAEKHLLRAIGLGSQHLSELNPYQIEIILTLGYLQEQRGYLDEATDTYKEVFRRLARSLPMFAPAFAVVEADLARVMQKNSKPDLAAMAFDLVVTNTRVNFGRESVAYALSLKELGALYRTWGDVELAQALVEAAEALLRRIGATDGVSATAVRLEQARVDAASGRQRQALDITRKLSESMEDEAGQIGVAENKGLAEAITFSHLDNLHTLIASGVDNDDRHAAEGLVTRQVLRRDAGLGRDVLLALNAFRDPQQAERLAQWRQTREKLAYSRAAREAAIRRPAEKRDVRLEGRLRDEQSEFRRTEQVLREQVMAALPGQNRLLFRDVVAARDLQRGLRSGEALLSWLFDDVRGYLWVITPDRLQMVTLDIGRIELGREVGQLRRGLDQADVTQIDQMRPFDFTRAHALYRRIFAPAVPLLGDIRRLHLVLDGPLREIPLGVLVVAPPAENRGNAAALPVRWLATEYNLRVHPSEGALTWAIGRDITTVAPQPIVGFGDARFEGYQERYNARFNQLPDTVVELAAATNQLGGDMKFMFTQNDATESTLRATSLTDFRIIYFATHTLLSDEAEKRGIAIEPGILLTPTKASSALDDGFVSASEIAGLRLNAELVVLSGCNTASADGVSGARGLSGLTRAFFIAGARSVIASHWSISSRATTQLLGLAFSKMTGHREIELDEALRLAIIDMANGKFGDTFRHPAFWAPFTIYGDPVAHSAAPTYHSRPGT